MLLRERISGFIHFFPIADFDKDSKKAVYEFENQSDYKYEYCQCLQCQSNSYDTLFKNDRYGIRQHTVICLDCGFVYSNPRLDKESMKLFYESGHYRRIYGGGTPSERYKKSKQIDVNSKKSISFHRYDANNYFYYINNTISDYKSVCEIGAGAGWNLIPFITNKCEVIGYEPDRQFVEIGQNNGINIKEGLSDEISNKADLVIMKHVLEHLHDPISELRHIRNYVEKYIYIEVPGFETMIPKIQNAHLSYFSINTLKSIMSKVGFRCLNIDYYSNNNYITSVFEKTDEDIEYKYDFLKEIKEKKKLVMKYTAKKLFKLFK